MVDEFMVIFNNQLESSHNDIGHQNQGGGTGGTTRNHHQCRSSDRSNSSEKEFKEPIYVNKKHKVLGAVMYGQLPETQAQAQAWAKKMQLK